MSDDRLAEIEQRMAAWSGAIWMEDHRELDDMDVCDDLAWLISEVKRLRVDYAAAQH